MNRLIELIRWWWRHHRTATCQQCAGFDDELLRYRPTSGAWKRTAIRYDAHKAAAHPHLIDAEWQARSRHDLARWNA